MQPCNKMDVVFVVDDSSSMSQEQMNLGQNFPMFAKILDDYVTSDGQKLDYRVAITTTGRTMHWNATTPLGPLPDSQTGDDGAFRMNCGMTRRWLEREDPAVEDTFACTALVGTDGPSYEMPLYSTMLSLRERIADGTNAGFLRADALLAIVMITDENDCSRHDDNFTLGFVDDMCGEVPATVHAADTIAFLDGLKQDRGRWAAAMIAGPNNCSSAFGDAEKATKLLQFVSLANMGGYKNTVFTSICDGSLAPSLMTALTTFTTACEAIPHIN